MFASKFLLKRRDTCKLKSSMENQVVENNESIPQITQEFTSSKSMKCKYFIGRRNKYKFD